MIPPEVIQTLQAISLGIGITTASVAGLVICIKVIYHKGKNEGIDQSCAERIENTLDHLDEVITDHIADDKQSFSNIDKRFDMEDEKTDRQHKAIYERLHSQDTVLYEIKGTVNVIKDKVIG